MPLLTVGVNERLMKLRIPLSRIRYLTIISTYAPTLTNQDDAKEQSYEQFTKSSGQPHRATNWSSLETNARVRRDYSSWEGVLGRHGVGKINDNGQLLLSKCAEHSLCITNALFRMADKYKTTWLHPRSKHWHLMDFIIVRHRDIRDIRVTRAIRGAECWTDHSQVCTDTAHCTAPLKPTQDCQGRLQCRQAEGPILQGTIPARSSKIVWPPKAALRNGPLSKKQSMRLRRKSLEGKLEPMKTSSMRMTKRPKPYMPRTSGSMTYIEWLNDPSSVSKRKKFKALQAKVQTDLRAVQDQWLRDKATKVQDYADTHNTKKFFFSLKTVFGPSASGSAPLLSSNEKTLIKDQEGISKRWRGHFSTLQNRPSSVDSDTLNQILQQPVRVSLAKSPTIEEIKKAIHQTISDRASGKDGIPAEIYKASGPPTLLTVWEEEMMSETSTTPWSSPSIRKREVSRTAGTTGVFSSSQLQERSLRESSLTDSSQSPNRPSLRHSAASALAGTL